VLLVFGYDQSSLGFNDINASPLKIFLNQIFGLEINDFTVSVNLQRFVDCPATCEPRSRNDRIAANSMQDTTAETALVSTNLICQITGHPTVETPL